MMVNKIFLIFLLCLFGLACTQKEERKVQDPDFEYSMGKDSPEWHSMLTHEGNRERLEMLKSIYESRKPSIVPASLTPKIPKCIHQVWLGPKSPPSYFWHYKKTWQENHPDWEYRLWTDKEVATLDFELKDLFMRSTNWGEKSDILRAELLDRFGGLYVDVDFENIKPFDALHMKYDFYTGLEPPHEGDFTTASPHLVISDALIGASPGHPIIKKWKELIRARWDDLEKKYPDGPKRVLLRAFYPFGEATASHIADPQFVNIVFPATYFYPLTFTQVSKGRVKRLNFIKQSARHVASFFHFKKPAPFVELQPETMAVHYWGNSWVKSHEERFREMHRCIVNLQGQVDQLKQEVDELKNAQN